MMSTDQPRSPDPRTWRSEKLSQRSIASYQPFTMVDGPGVRCAIYLSGCPFACPGCFNRAAQSFRYGEPFGEALLEKVVKDLDHDYVRGLTLLGGEPFLNTGVALELVSAARSLPGKDIWCWTGYTFEELLTDGSDDKIELLHGIDVLVDGRFELSLKDTGLRFRGSSNQRVLDVPASLEAGRAVPVEKYT